MAVEQDDDVMEQYLEGNEPSEEVLKECIRKGVLNQSFVPVLNGTAFKNKGVQPLLDAVVDFMPSPMMLKLLKVLILTLKKKLLENHQMMNHYLY